MKTKIAVISASALLAVGIGAHISGHCPLQQLKATTNHSAPASQQPSARDAKTSLVEAK